MKYIYLAVISMAVTACGYSPLYSSDVSFGMAGVKVNKVRMLDAKRNVGERRVAQYVSRHLRRSMRAENVGEYFLNVIIQEQVSTLAVQRDATESRLMLHLYADITLYKYNSEDVFTARVSQSATYNVEDTPYSTESGKENARKTAAKALAEEIIFKVALFLNADNK